MEVEHTSYMADDPFSPLTWKTLWEKKDTGWHTSNVHPRLVKYWNKFCPPDFTDHRVFVPLCGKSVDLGWMSTSKQCTVVGCDLAEVAVIEFVREHADLSFRKSTVKFSNGEDVVMYHTLDNNLRIYVCDLFSMESAPEDPFNLIWDRASFVAISPSLRTRYVALMSKLSTPDVRWLQETLNYPPGLHRGPPCSISSDEFSALYADLFDIETLEYRSVKHVLFKDAEYCYERLVLLTKKQH